MTITSQIEITARDSTAAAFAAANKNLSGLAASALQTSSALSAIGATAFLGSMVAFTKQTLDAQDSLSKLSQKTGIAVESLAGLEFAAEQSGVELDKVAKATRAFSLLVAESADSSSGAAKKLQDLGLSYKDLKDLSPEKQLLALADALHQFSEEDRAVAFTATLGQKMADLIPLLSGGSKELAGLIEQGKKLNPVTAESAKKAEQFNDQMNLLSKQVSVLGRSMIQDLIPGFARITDEMVKATEKSGIFAGALAGVKQLFTESFGNPKILGDVGQIRREIIKTQETIDKLSTKKDSVFFDNNALLHEKEKLTQLEIDLQKAIGTSRQVIAAQDSSTESTKKFAIAVEETNKPLATRAAKIDRIAAAMSDQGRIESEYVKLLGVERKAQEDLLRPYQQNAQSAKDRLDTMRNEARALDLSRSKQISLQEAIELTTISRLEEKRAITKDGGAVQAIDQEIAARKEIISVIKQGEDKTKNLSAVTRNTTDEVSQLWMQAGRNIQSTLANSIFNFFDDGLKGMLKNVISTVGRIASEFAALKLAQGIGLAGIFGGGIGGTGAAAGGASLLSNVGSGAGIMGTLKNFGGGITSGISGLMSGGGVGALALPLLGGFALNSMSNAFAGDKTLGNGFTDFMQKIPILGAGWDIMAGLFGHGPMKFRQQSIQGTASADGFDGDISNVFRAKGGLFVGNKHRTQTEEFSKEQQAIFDGAIGGFYTSARGFVDNLGLSADLVDNFSQQVQIKSEKGKTVTEEAIAEMIAGIGDSLAKNVLPNVEDFRSAGETTIQTLSRLSGEFSVLTNAAQLLFNQSSELSKSFIKQFSFSDRSSFLEQAGGTDAFAANVSGFAQNFLTDEQRIKPIIEALVTERDKLGLSGINTRAQFSSAVQSGNLNPDQLLFLLNNQEAANQVFTYFEKFNSAVTETAAVVEDQTKKIADSIAELERGSITSAIDGWKNLIDTVTGEIDKLNDFANTLKGTVDSINPQGIDSARAEIVNATAQAGQGNITDVSSALEKLSNQSSEGFSTREAFARSKAFSVDLINGLSNAVFAEIADKQKTIGIYSNNINLLGGSNPEKSGAMTPAQQNDAVLKLLQDLITKTASGGKYSKDLYDLLKNMTNNGTALNTAVV